MRGASFSGFSTPILLVLEIREKARYNRSMSEVMRGKVGLVKANMVIEKPNLLWRLKRDYPNLKWREGRKFTFRPPRMIVFEALDSMKFAKSTAENGEKKVGAFSSGLLNSNTQIQLMNKENMQDEHLAILYEQNLWNMQLLHEVGHALLKHRDYVTDIERVKMERAAWEKARELYMKYAKEVQGEENAYRREVEVFKLGFDEEFVEVEMDTYRDWLHRKSRCPECGLTCYQTVDREYHCPQCEQNLYI